VLDCQGEIDSDLSVFHGVRDPLAELDSPRYFTFVEQLHCYSGAVRAWWVRQIQQRQPQMPSVAVPSGEVQRVDDPRALEVLTNQNGFAGFEYVGGG
jgi:hypothetical protein